MQPRIAASLLAIVAAVSFIVGYSLRGPGANATGSERKPLYYHDPMHPSYRSDKPGIAPDCGMQLEPVYADSLAGTATRAADRPGTLRISFDKQQMMGLKTETVGRSSGTHSVRVLGRVAADESRIHRVSALIEGVIRSVSPYAVGNVVPKDALLAVFFVASRDLYRDFQSYFTAMGNLDRVADANPKAEKAQVRMREELLKTYGVTEAQLADVGRSGQVTRDIEFRSPVAGVVLARNAAPGQRVDKGAEVFRVADISRVWVLADLFENESGLVRTDMPARVRYQGRTYRAAISEARQFDPASRTLKVRLDLDNPDLVLRPDMFVDVEFESKEPEGISVPVDAVLDSGRRKTVFVSTSEGTFEPREVITGVRYGDRVQIVSGLAGGERLVVSGLFLLDSESRLQASAARSQEQKPAAGPMTDPVCGMAVASNGGNESVFEGTKYRFCSKDCKGKFDASPARFASRNTAPAQPGGTQ